MAQTVNFLQEHKLLAYSDLEEKAKKCTATFDELNTQIKTAEKRMAEIQVLKKHIINYAKTRDVYTDYRKAGYSRKFCEEHRAGLTLHKSTKAAFDELGIKKCLRHLNSPVPSFMRGIRGFLFVPFSFIIVL